MSLKKEVNEFQLLRSESTDRKERRELTLKIWDNEERLREIKNSTNITTVKFPCVNSECRGIISHSSNDLDIMRCGLCKTNVCTRCQSGCESEDNHTCDTNVIENIKAIDISSKPCPSCSVRITRIDGCSQMFCTQCFTLFDYYSLKVENGFRHNPHYLTWVANNPELKDDVNKNVQEDPEDKYLNFSAENLRWTLGDAYRSMSQTLFLETREIPQYANMHKACTERLLSMYYWVYYWGGKIKISRSSIIYDEDANHNNRVKYLKNEITEEEFKNRIYRKCFDIEYNRKIIDVFFNISVVAKSMRIIPRARDSTKNLEELSDLLSRVEKILFDTANNLKALNRIWMKRIDCDYTLYQEEQAAVPPANDTTVATDSA